MGRWIEFFELCWHVCIDNCSSGSASGERLPPFILYKGKNLYRRWMEGGPAAAENGISNWLDGWCKLFVTVHKDVSACCLIPYRNCTRF